MASTRTKTELAKLASAARGMACYRISATRVEFTCPLDVEAKRKAWDQTCAHRFAVEHLPWEKGTTAAEVRTALERHIDPDWEECEHVTFG